MGMFQGLPKSDKMDLIIQKCVELGVFRIVPVTTKRTVVKLDAKKEESRRKRWTAVSESAAKQSGRGIIPEISGVRGFKEAVEEAGELDVCLIPYEKAENMARTREILSGIPAGASIGVFIGPEGGFEEEEVRGARGPSPLGGASCARKRLGWLCWPCLDICWRNRLNGNISG